MSNAKRYSIIAAIALAFVAIIWVGSWIAVGSKIPPKTRFLEVDISRLSTTEAAKKISQTKKSEISGELKLNVDSKKFTIPVVDSGVRLDIEKSLSTSPKRSWNPRQLFTLLFETKYLEPIVITDKEAFRRAIRSIEREVNRPPRNADIVYDGIVPKILNSRAGKSIDREEALDVIAQQWLRSDVIELRTKTRAARISDDEARELLTFAENATSAPVSVTLAIEKPVTFSLTPNVIAQALTFIPGRGEKLEAKWLKATFINAVGKKWASHVVEPVNASFSISGGQPRVQPSRDGLDVPEEKLSSALIAALAKTGAERRATLTPEPVAAKITTEMAGGLGIKEVIGTFTTFFPYAEYRIINIQRAARWMDGVIVKPGEVFSYNKSVGERTEARGFVPGIMIDRGVFKKDWGGGVSQVATTTWNAAWFSGLELLQHKPHSFYISRYPAGRESTVAWPSVDVKFRNNSGHPIFVDTSFTNKSVTVTIYGTKFVDVETESGPRTKPVDFKVLENDSEGCIFQEGVAGFTIDVWRILKKDGIEVKREKYRTRYLPEDRIICTNPKARWMNPPLDVQRALTR